MRSAVYLCRRSVIITTTTSRTLTKLLQFELNSVGTVTWITLEKDVIFSRRRFVALFCPVLLLLLLCALEQGIVSVNYYALCAGPAAAAVFCLVTIGYYIAHFFLWFYISVFWLQTERYDLSWSCYKIGDTYFFLSWNWWLIFFCGVKRIF